MGAASGRSIDEWQLDMDGYDADHYMDMALMMPGEDINDAQRRSYVPFRHQAGQ